MTFQEAYPLSRPSPETNTVIVQGALTDPELQDIETEHGPTVLSASTPSVTVSALEKWNHPRSNIYKTLTTFWSFLVMGANDAAYGVRSVLISVPILPDHGHYQIKRERESANEYYTNIAINSICMNKPSFQFMFCSFFLSFPSSTTHPNAQIPIA